MSVGDENVLMFTIDAETIRDHFDAKETQPFTDGQLNEAGAVVINQLSDLFWQALDSLFMQALDVAQAIKESEN